MEKVYNLIIVAMKEEEEAILNSLNVKIFKDDNHYSFKLNNEEFLLFRGQIGKVMTSFMLGKIFSKYSIKRVFNLGTSGGYSKDIKALDIVIATKVGYFDVDVTAFNYSLGQVPEFPRFFETDMDYIEKKKDKLDKIDSFDIKYGLILSSDSFITKKNYLDYPLLKQDDPLCVEMARQAFSFSCTAKCLENLAAHPDMVFLIAGWNETALSFLKHYMIRRCPDPRLSFRADCD